MKRKLLELKNSRTAQINAAEKALKDGDSAAYDTAMGEITKLNGEIDKVEKLLGEQNRYAAPPAPGADPTAPENPEDKSRSEQLKALRGSNEYARAFCKALRSGARPDVYREALSPLYKALTIAGGDPVGSDGGFLVPMDMETRIIEIAQELPNLAQYVNTETVSVNSGIRTLEADGARKPFPLVGEMAAIGKTAQPRFKQLSYNCGKYGDRLPISNELLADATSFMEYVARWFAQRYVATQNELIRGLLDTLPFTAFAGATDTAIVKEVNRVFNKGLKKADSKAAVILTNQSGYDVLDSLLDGNGRPLLKPDLSGDFTHYKGRRCDYFDDALFENHAVGEVNYAPLYIGNLRAAITLFVRNGITMATTNVGGDAWENDCSEVRALCRMDAKFFEADAVVFRGFKLA